MSVEAIEKVTQTEQEAKQRKDAAAAESKQKLQTAQRAAQRMLEEARTNAEAQARQMMAQAEAPGGPAEAAGAGPGRPGVPDHEAGRPEPSGAGRRIDRRKGSEWLMAIVKMDHVRLIAMTEDREEILRRLQRLGCVEIDQAVLPDDQPQSGRPAGGDRQSGPPAGAAQPPGRPAAERRKGGAESGRPRTVCPEKICPGQRKISGAKAQPGRGGPV